MSRVYLDEDEGNIAFDMNRRTEVPHLTYLEEKRSDWSAHKRPSFLHLNSAYTSVDHLLSRQERRSSNLRNISQIVNP
jgi:hypothetical protein